MNLSLLRLPLLVSIEVFNLLEFQEIFLLSLCSNHMKHLVRRIMLKPKNIKYTLDVDKIQVAIGLTETNWDTQPMVDMKCVSFIDCEEKMSVKLGGVDIICSFVENDSDDRLQTIDRIKRCTHTFQYLKESNYFVLELLKHHVEYLFPKRQLETQLEFNSIDCLPCADVFHNVKNTSFNFDDFESSEIEDLLTTHPNLDSLDIRSKPTGRDMKCNSKIWEIKGLAFQHCQKITCRLMKYFSGRCLILRNAKLIYSSWSKLIQRWKKNRAYYNLHAVIVSTPEDRFEDFDSQKLYEECNAMRWDGLRRPKMFKFDPKIINLKRRKPQMIDCSDWYDIQQNNGEKWASIRITSTQICFFVWN